MLIDEAGAIDRLRAGEVVALPTDTVYGLVVALEADGGTERVFAIKERPEAVALPVFVADPAEASEIGVFNDAARQLAERHWPGALTVVVTRRGASTAWDLGGDGATIGLRCPDDDAVRRIARAVGPLAVTSANRHGEPPCTTAIQVTKALGAEVPVLDGGIRDGTPSTVVDVTAEMRVLRHGTVVPDGHEPPLGGSSPP